MSDDPNRKKSLREQVEEYKRGQKEAEERAARKAGSQGAEDAAGDRAGDEDLDEEEVDDEDEDEGWTPLDEKAAAAHRAEGFKVVKIVSTVFLGVGLVLLLTSAAIFWVTRQSVAAEVTTEGVVVDNIVRKHTSRPSGSSRDVTSDYYHAVVEFQVGDGTTKKVEMAAGNWPKAFEEGERVKVRYDPKSPLHARIGGGSAMDFFGALITGFLGAVFTAIAIGVRRAFS